MTCFNMFVDKVNKLSEGELTIDIIGGPEIMGIFDIGPAVQKGVVDIGFVFPSAYKGLVPGIQGAFLGNIELQEERDGGAYDFMNEMHKKAGLFYLGKPAQTSPELPWVMYPCTNKYVETPLELKGQKWGEGTSFFAFQAALGTIPTFCLGSDMYIPLEEGVVDGFILPPLLAVDASLQEVTKYIIDEPFMKTSLVIFMNLDKQNSLPEHLQEVLMQAMIETEQEGGKVYTGIQTESLEKMKAAGMETIKWTPEDEKWWYDTLFETEWDAVIEEAPEVGPQLKELLLK